MKKPYRYFSEEVKKAAVGRIAAGEPVLSVARDIGANRGRLYDWYSKYQEGGVGELRRVGRPRKADAQSARGLAWKDAPDEKAALRRQIAELERKIGQQQVDLDFFRRALRHVEETRRAPGTLGAAASTKSSKR
jgi:transposase-like protein